jgi:hypothetical protein
VAVAGVGGGEEKAEAELIGWRRYRSEQRIALRKGMENEQEAGRRQSTGAGNVLGQEAQGEGKGRETAPSSLGRSRERDTDHDPGRYLERD